MVPEHGTRWALKWTHPFFEVPTLEFGHGAGGRVQWAPDPCVYTTFVKSRADHCSFFALAAKLMFQNGVG